MGNSKEPFWHDQTNYPGNISYNTWRNWSTFPIPYPDPYCFLALNSPNVLIRHQPNRNKLTPYCPVLINLTWPPIKGFVLSLHFSLCMVAMFSRNITLPMYAAVFLGRLIRVIYTHYFHVHNIHIYIRYRYNYDVTVSMYIGVPGSSRTTLLLSHLSDRYDSIFSKNSVYLASLYVCIPVSLKCIFMHIVFRCTCTLAYYY